MSETRLPYVFQEGSKAYAAKVMANFYALLNALNVIKLDGMESQDLASLLQILANRIDACVPSGITGNAASIKFGDGETMQQKLENGDFNGVDAVSVINHMYKLYVDAEDGHLKVCLPSDAATPPLSIDNNGHLIYTVAEATDTANAIVYDLGNVRGAKGDTGAAGGMQAVVYDPTGQARDIFAAIKEAINNSKPSNSNLTLTSASWDAQSKQAIISLTGITATNDFDVDTGYTVTAAQQEAWLAAKPKIIAQAAGSFTIEAFGNVPVVDIPLTVRIYPG